MALALTVGKGGCLMSDTNKRNLVYFENPAMRGLYKSMEDWQEANNKRLLSISIQQDRGNYCCVAMTDPTEVVIKSEDVRHHAGVSEETVYGRGVALGKVGRLYVSTPVDPPR
jgi:hypothetical protein